MPAAPLPPNQSQRIAALRSYGILDTPPEAAFDDLTRIASLVCGAPIAVVNLIDEGRQWFKSEVGLGVRETPLDSSFCAHAILQPGLFVVADTLQDPRFVDNPLVAGDPRLRFYAGALLQSPEGHALGTVCVLDYQPRQLSEDQRSVLLSLARQAMAQLELRRALAAAERTNDYRSRLMAVAGHDLKQPLQVVSMVLDRVDREVSDPKTRDRLGLARASVVELSKGLDSLAVASRPDDPGSPSLTDFSVADLFGAVLPTWRQHAERKGLQLRVRHCPVTVRSDFAMLTTILANLVGNAIKYTQGGGVLVACRRRGAALLVEVFDTGVGISPDSLDLAFEPFRQLDPKAEGLGLGLSIVRRTAELLGHRLLYASLPGRGSRFAVEVPIADA